MAAQRGFSAVIGLFAAAGLAAALTFTISATSQTRPEAALPEAADGAIPNDSSVITTAQIVPAEALPSDEPAIRAMRATIGSGGTLGAAIEALGISSDLTPALVRAIASEIDVRRLPPQTGLVAMLAEDGVPRSVALRNESGRFLRIRCDEQPDCSTPQVGWVELPRESRVATAVGEVEDCVAQALAAAPHSNRLTRAFADMFQWDIDLLVEPRRGDVVRVVYEIEHLGETPGDLPEFGESATRPGEFLGLGRILAASYEGQLVRTQGFWIEDGEGWGNYFDAEGSPLRKSFLKSPLNYRRISSGFSRARRHPVTRRVVPHHGVDFAAAPGTPVVATADGSVIVAGWDGPLGRSVRIRHGSEYVTIYGHLRALAKGIARGSEVRQNEVIGYVGSTGRATGPHLHYGVQQHGRAVDPFRIKNPPADPLPEALRPSLESTRRRWSPVLAAMRPEGEIRMAAGLGSPVEIRTGS